MTNELGVWTADDCAFQRNDRSRAGWDGAREPRSDDRGVAYRPLVGLSVPVIGAGIALDQGASAPNTVLGFAILVGLGVAGAGWGLLARRPKSAPQVA
jgi:hypothetical protein